MLTVRRVGRVERVGWVARVQVVESGAIGRRVEVGAVGANLHRGANRIGAGIEIGGMKLTPTPSSTGGDAEPKSSQAYLQATLVTVSAFLIK